MTNPAEMHGGARYSLAELYRLEYATRHDTLDLIKANCYELERLDDLALPNDRLDRQMHQPTMPDPYQERQVLIRRWPYEMASYIAEIIVTDRQHTRSENDVIDNAVYRIDTDASNQAISASYHQGFASGNELVLPTVAGPTIWRNSEGLVGLEYGCVDIEPVPADVMGDLSTFIAGRIAATKLLESVCVLGSDTLSTSFQFAPE